MTPPLDIEDDAQLLDYLRHTGKLAPGETPIVESLGGGVSNRTRRLTFPSGEAWVLKQALAKLRVREDWFSDPARIEREALALRSLPAVAPPGTVPDFRFADPAQHLLAMSAVARPHENWKERLLRGEVRDSEVEQFAVWLGRVHAGSRARAEEFRAGFADRTFFQTLRLDPYYRTAASRHPVAQDFYRELIAETLATAQCLVHGDFSPKNALVREGRLVLLDFEVIHFGDPTFDVGFALTHLLSKANHLPLHRPAFAHAATRFWTTYAEAAQPWVAGHEARSVRHALGCLLARVDGRSPLEYLTEEEQARQRHAVLALVSRPPATVPELIDSFCVLLDARP